MLRSSSFWWSIISLGYFFLNSAKQVCMKRTVTLGDFLDLRFSVSGCSVCHESCDQWRGIKRKILFCKEVFKHYLNLLCPTKTQVYMQITHLFWMLASIFSLVSIFPFVFLCALIISYLSPPESCSDISYATYCAFVHSRMHKFWVWRNGYVQPLQVLLQIVEVY